MKFQLLFIFFWLLSLSVLGQEEKIKTWQLRWAASSLADPRTPSLQLGLQKNLTSKWAISLEYSLSAYGVLAKKWYSDSVREDFRYQKFRAELKYFYLPRQISEKVNANFYLGLEEVFIPERYQKHSDYFRREGKLHEYQFSRIKNNIWVTAAKSGLEWQYKRKWVLDTYAGFGVRMIHVRHYDTIPGELPDTGIRWFAPQPRDQTEGWHHTFHVAGGFKLGYYIW